MAASGPDPSRTRSMLVDDGWPIVLVVLPEKLGEPDVLALIALFEGLYARGAPFSLITDARPVTAIPAAKERQHLASWLSRPDQLENQRRLNVGSSTVMQSALVRGALQALYWLWTPPNPQHAARDLDEAFEFCGGRLVAAGVPLPAPIAELRARVDRALARR